MATEPLVSVIMPAYRAKTISFAAAPSPLAQGRPCWQVASDDGIDDLAVLTHAGVRNTMAENGRPPRVEAELARLLEEPPRAA
jgi:hypothetical protein